MSAQVLSDQVSAPAPPEAWVHLLRAHASLMRRLNSDLVAEHGLTINDFEVLLRLSHAPERRMRRVDIAESVLLTPSGITRLLDGLERAGLVGRKACDSDRRVVYAGERDAGRAGARDAEAAGRRPRAHRFAAHA